MSQGSLIDVFPEHQDWYWDEWCCEMVTWESEGSQIKKIRKPEIRDWASEPETHEWRWRGIMKKLFSGKRHNSANKLKHPNSNYFFFRPEPLCACSSPQMTSITISTSSKSHSGNVEVLVAPNLTSLRLRLHCLWKPLCVKPSLMHLGTLFCSYDEITQIPKPFLYHRFDVQS